MMLFRALARFPIIPRNYFISMPGLHWHACFGFIQKSKSTFGHRTLLISFNIQCKFPVTCNNPHQLKIISRQCRLSQLPYPTKLPPELLLDRNCGLKLLTCLTYILKPLNFHFLCSGTVLVHSRFNVTHLLNIILLLISKSIFYYLPLQLRNEIY